jgi:hypothetical protein
MACSSESVTSAWPERVIFSRPMAAKTRSAKLAVTALAIFAAGWFIAHAARRTTAASAPGRVVGTGDTTVPRFSHTATLLPNGRVLIAGGMARNGIAEPTAEIYDPRTGQFAPAGKLASPRGWGATATLLPNGKVLLAGGASGSWCDASCFLATAELYDPSTNTFTPTGGMTTQRAAASAVLLRNGDVLILGGQGPAGAAPLASAELYHPSTGTFSITGSMNAAKVAPAALLENGKVLIVGGSADAELYDPATGRFATTGSLTTGRTSSGAALLPDGKVLVVGGGGGRDRLSSTEIYDPVTGRFTPGPDMKFKRYKLPDAVVALRDGRILVGGGAEQPEVYDPASNSFLSTGGTKLDGFCFSSATPLPNGEALLVGGYNTSTWVAVNHAWLYQP